MTPEMEALGRSALEAGWRWMGGARVLPMAPCFPAYRLGDDPDQWPHDLGLRVPDLSDPATLGTLIAQARGALGEPNAYAVHANGEWYIERDGGVCGTEGLDYQGEWGAGGADVFICEPSEPAAWVAALEAAGRRA